MKRIANMLISAWMTLLPGVQGGAFARASLEAVKAESGLSYAAVSAEKLKEDAKSTPTVKGVAAESPETGKEEFGAQINAAIVRRIEAEEGEGVFAEVIALRVHPAPAGAPHTRPCEARVVITRFAGPDRFDQKYTVLGFYDEASKEASVAWKTLSGRKDDPWAGAAQPPLSQTPDLSGSNGGGSVVAATGFGPGSFGLPRGLGDAFRFPSSGGFHAAGFFGGGDEQEGWHLDRSRCNWVCKSLGCNPDNGTCYVNDSQTKCRND